MKIVKIKFDIGHREIRNTYATIYWHTDGRYDLFFPGGSYALRCRVVDRVFYCP